MILVSSSVMGGGGCAAAEDEPADESDAVDRVREDESELEEWEETLGVGSGVGVGSGMLVWPARGYKLVLMFEKGSMGPFT